MKFVENLHEIQDKFNMKFMWNLGQIHMKVEKYENHMNVVGKPCEICRKFKKNTTIVWKPRENEKKKK